ALRVLIVWLHRSAGRSVWAAALFHATVNLSFFAFPNGGSHYDPCLAGLLVALTAALVTRVWPAGAWCRARGPARRRPRSRRAQTGDRLRARQRTVLVRDARPGPSRTHVPWRQPGRNGAVSSTPSWRSRRKAKVLSPILLLGLD